MYSKSLLFVNFVNIVLLLINCTEAEVLEGFNIKIFDHGESVNVTLKKVYNSYLANENLPVWTMEENEVLPYEELKIMSKLGTLVPYFNYEKKAAFIYSSNCNCLNGVIGIRYVIKKFPMHLLFHTQIIGESEFIMRRNITLSKRSNSTRKIIPRTAEELKINERAVNKTLYPEILIVIKNDFYSNLKSTNISNEEMILYVISLMNAADMLYSPGETLKVKLNIAGIIIESKKNLLPAVEGYSDKEYLSVESLVHGVVNSKYSYFEKSKLNPSMSYDWIFFLTSKKLSYSDHHNLTRMSSYPKRGIVKSRQDGCGSYNMPISIITDDYKFNSYPTIGHEIFHLIIHGSHKEVENGICHPGFLDAYDAPDLEKFQWSDDCCLLTNKPQSLDFRRPPMDLKYQCQCYGYEKNYFLKPTECTDMLICEDAKKNERSVPRIVDDEFCREKWERKRAESLTSLYIGTSTVSTTTKQFIPPLTPQKECSWITENELWNLMFVFPKDNEETDDDGLVCLAIILDGNYDSKLAFTAKSCVKNQIKLRNHRILKEDKYIFAESQSDADFSVTEEFIDDFDTDTASLSLTDGISEEFTKLSSLMASPEIIPMVIRECRLINVTKMPNPIKPFIITYIPMDISIQREEGSTFNYIIKSANPVDKSELWGLKGNPLFCRFSSRKTQLVGILVNDDYDKHLRFVNIADYKETLQYKMN
ncbi:uncharacterized protein [Chelonus insularis]|uniref:uncharacterized protein n=1 Tax=Chelonus insularis TaxID=460826 RepID=UPI001589D078|nr:uncharacterized protein LOC118072154 [Chelonus insularis]